MVTKKISLSKFDFKDKNISNWITIQSLNQVSKDLRENHESILGTIYFLISIIMGIMTTYYLSQGNWIMVFILIIALELMAIKRITHLKKIRKGMFEIQRDLIKFCQDKQIVDFSS